jgi:hypothetical protein
MSTETIPQAALPVAAGETASSALAMQVKALVEARYLVALSRPRDWDTVRERVLKECSRPGFAAVARYHKPIGKGVEGPSIRFAEAAIRCMTNVVVETMTIFDDATRRIVRVSVTDLEANVPYSQDVTINKEMERRALQPGETPLRSRIGSGGHTVYIMPATDDDILNRQNALISKAVRTLGLRLLPGDIYDEAMTRIAETLRSADAKDPDAARKKLFDAFSTIGITAAQLKEYVAHDGPLTPKEMADLRGLYAALRDGETTWRDVMDARQPQGESKADEGKGVSGLKAKIAEAK